MRRATAEPLPACWQDTSATGKHMEITENVLICKCKKVTLADIENALHDHTDLRDVENEFRHVQEVTHCSTGCGGCHDKIMEVISSIISG